MQASLSNPTNSAASERVLELQEKIGDSNIDRNFIDIIYGLAGSYFYCYNVIATTYPLHHTKNKIINYKTENHQPKRKNSKYIIYDFF